MLFRDNRNDKEVMKMINTIIQGNCEEVLRTFPDECIDLVVTDPPYNSKAISWDCKDNIFQVKWLEQVKRVMKNGASIYIYSLLHLTCFL